MTTCTYCTPAAKWPSHCFDLELKPSSMCMPQSRSHSSDFSLRPACVGCTLCLDGILRVGGNLYANSFIISKNQNITMRNALDTAHLSCGCGIHCRDNTVCHIYYIYYCHTAFHVVVVFNMTILYNIFMLLFPN